MAMTVEQITEAINASGIGMDELPVVLASGALLVREAAAEDTVRKIEASRAESMATLDAAYAKQIAPYKEAYEAEVLALNEQVDKARAELKAIQAARLGK
jgi:hypothetical protein